MSKELKALQDLASGQYVGAWKDKCVKVIEKSLKALEILKEKDISLSLIKCSKDYEDFYRFNNWLEGQDKITKKEYNLLRKVLL